MINYCGMYSEYGVLCHLLNFRLVCVLSELFTRTAGIYIIDPNFSCHTVCKFLWSKFELYMKANGVKHIHTCPLSNGETELFIQTLNNVLTWWREIDILHYMYHMMMKHVFHTQLHLLKSKSFLQGCVRSMQADESSCPNALLRIDHLIWMKAYETCPCSWGSVLLLYSLSWFYHTEQCNAFIFMVYEWCPTGLLTSDSLKLRR